MKGIVKRLLPNRVLDYRAKRKYLKQKSNSAVKSSAAIFKQIYSSNTWGSDESISGQGSTLLHASKAVQGVSEVIKQFKIQSILDLPCGDYHWMQKVDLTHVHYIGADIVPDLIADNQTRYGSQNLQFESLDLIQDALPKADLVVVRDCLVHLSYEDIAQALINLKRSGSKYLLTTSFSKLTLNYNINTGDWRPLNLQKKPFHFPQPIWSINEYFDPNYKRDYRGKSLLLWEISSL